MHPSCRSYTPYFTMAPYDDSDSSGAEDADFTETNVLLGYASKDADDDTISKLGGRPVSAPR
jgi:pre-rRNA-processing protein TSR4